MTSAHRKTARLALQLLEPREVPTANLAAGILTVRGTDMNEDIAIDSVFWDGVEYVRVNENGQITDFLASAVKRVRVFAGGGHDDISHNVGRLNAALFGEAGDDLIYGDAGRDYLNGGAGFDTLKGYGGNDMLVGGPDNDKLYGGDGYDLLYGGLGNDWLNAGSRTEPAYGGLGWDTNAHIWAYNGARATDINQQAGMTCVFLASLAGVAQTGLMNLAGQISYIGNDTYTVRMYVNGFWQDVEVRFNGNFTMDDTGTYDCLSDREGEFWQLLYQRAYMRMIGYDPYNAASMAMFDGEGTAIRALTMISGWSAQAAVIDATLTPQRIQGLIRDGYAVNGMYAAHEYAFTNVYWYAGRWYVRIYNPYGVDRVHDAGLHPGRDGVNDGFTTITWENFMATFYKYNWA